MAYSILSDWQLIEPLQKIQQLSDDNGIGTLDSNITGKCVAAADDYINARLKGIGVLPFVAPYPAIIVLLSSRLTIYYLYCHRFGVLLPDGVIELLKNCDKILSDIVSGDIIVSDEQESVSADNSSVEYTRDKVYTETLMSCI